MHTLLDDHKNTSWDDAYEQGYDAYSPRNAPRNPHTDPELRDAWQTGWDAHQCDQLS